MSRWKRPLAILLLAALAAQGVFEFALLLNAAVGQRVASEEVVVADGVDHAEHAPAAPAHFWESLPKPVCLPPGAKLVAPIPMPKGKAAAHRCCCGTGARCAMRPGMCDCGKPKPPASTTAGVLLRAMGCHPTGNTAGDALPPPASVEFKAVAVALYELPAFTAQAAPLPALRAPLGVVTEPPTPPPRARA